MWSLDPLLKRPQQLASTQAREVNFWKDVHTHKNGSSGSRGNPMYQAWVYEMGKDAYSQVGHGPM